MAILQYYLGFCVFLDNPSRKQLLMSLLSCAALLSLSRQSGYGGVRVRTCLS